ncbi:MAG: Flp pilus assembly protein CpaB [Pseudomonadota bacterium]
MRILLFLFAVLIVAAGAGAYLFLQQPPPAPVQVAAPVERAPKPPKKVEVYAPVHPVAAGTIITEQVLRRLTFEPDVVSDEMVLADEEGAEFLLGGVARQSLAEGLPIARSSIIHPGDRGFLAAVLPPGMRAISIEISEVAGLSGLVLPGDHVDIILTYSIVEWEEDRQRDIFASETVVRDLRVLALDQRVQAVRQEFDENGIPLPPPVASTATLQVTPRQAEMLTLASELGTLSLVLNSAQDGLSPSGATSGFDSIMESLSRSGPNDVKRAAPTALQVGRGLTMDSDVTRLRAASRIQVVRGTSAKPAQVGGEAIDSAISSGSSAYGN